jgi:addiction module HigA family antidote
MAIRLAGALGTEPEIWVNMQAQYDLWEAAQKAPPKVKVLSAA